MSAYNKNTIKYKIIEYVRANPHCSRNEIIAGINYTGRAGAFSTVLSNLRTYRVLDHNGGNSQTCKWHVVENEVIPIFLEMAEDILDDLSTTHPSIRARHLAQRLQDLLGESIENDSNPN